MCIFYIMQLIYTKKLKYVSFCSLRNFKMAGKTQGHKGKSVE